MAWFKFQKEDTEKTRDAESQVRWNGSSFEQKTKELISARRQHFVCHCL
jgi:hypothetical protein